MARQKNDSRTTLLGERNTDNELIKEVVLLSLAAALAFWTLDLSISTLIFVGPTATLQNPFFSIKSLDAYHYSLYTLLLLSAYAAIRILTSHTNLAECRAKLFP